MPFNFFRAYLDKTISLQLNKGRKVTGTLRGYDQFMNIVLGDAVEEKVNQKNNLGVIVIRGNSILQVCFQFKKKILLNFIDFFF